MSNTVVISPYTQHNFSSIKLCLCNRLQRFIFVNPQLFELNIVRKDIFHHLYWYSWETLHSSTLKDLLQRICEHILLIKCMRKSKTQFSHFSYHFQVVTDCGLGCVEVLILEYFFRDCIPPILLKNLKWGLMSMLIWVHLSEKYCQNETLKISFGHIS